jgi:hypothetical protein
MTKVVMTGSSAARSAKGRKPNGIINAKQRLPILPQRVFQRNWRLAVIQICNANDRNSAVDSIGQRNTF